jgi:anti-sigma-K factor RskA
MSQIVSDFNSGFWAFAVVAGPIILAIALWFGIRQSRRRRSGPRVPGTEISGSVPTAAERDARTAR